MGVLSESVSVSRLSSSSTTAPAVPAPQARPITAARAPMTTRSLLRIALLCIVPPRSGAPRGGRKRRSTGRYLVHEHQAARFVSFRHQALASGELPGERHVVGRLTERQRDLDALLI